MKTKAIIISLAAACTLTIGILVACSKEPTKANDTTDVLNERIPSKTLTENQRELMDSLNHYWRLCESAYRTDSNMFMTICGMENYSGYYAMTGISMNQVLSILRMARVELSSFLLENPKYDEESEYCSPCISVNLRDWAVLVASFHDVIEEISQFDSTFAGGIILELPPMNECQWRCLTMLGLTDSQAHICYLRCLLEMNLVNAREYLHALEVMNQPN